jgi:hypothetical protein
MAHKRARLNLRRGLAQLLIPLSMVIRRAES